MNRQGTFVLALLLVITLWQAEDVCAQGAQTQWPDMSYLKSQTPRVAAKDMGMVTADGYYDNLEMAKKQPEKVVRLNLQGRNLRQIPTDLCLFPNLEELDLSNNAITTLDVSFQCPSHLKKLYVNGNQLKSIPAKVSLLSSLEVLVAHDNPIDQIDPSIGTMQQMKELWLSGNGNPASFQKAVLQLKGLQTLRLWNFGFQTVPAGISELRQLKTLCLAHNAVSNLDPKVCSLPALEYLNLGDNQLHGLPAEIRQCTQLGYLGIYENPITSLPEDFAVLSKNLERISAWQTGLPVAVQNRIKETFPKTALMFEAVNLH